MEQDAPTLRSHTHDVGVSQPPFSLKTLRKWLPHSWTSHAGFNPIAAGMYTAQTKESLARMIWVVRNPSLARYWAATGRVALAVAPVLRASCSARRYEKENEE